MRDHTKTQRTRAETHRGGGRTRAHRRRHRHGRRHHTRILPIHPDRLRGIIDRIHDPEVLEVLQRDLEQALLDVTTRRDRLAAAGGTETGGPKPAESPDGDLD